MNSRLVAPVLLVLALAAVPAASAAAPGVKAAGTCPQFRVMHNDHIGSVKFPAGAYNMVTSQLSCQQSTVLFQQFLDRPSGNLPRPWKLALLSGQRRRFTKVGTKTDFQATPATPSPSPSTLTCPGTFAVLHNDRIGSMKLPAGNYRIARLTTKSLSCYTASYDFKYFLDHDSSGHLPSPWYTNPSTKTFYRGSSTDGFRVTKTSSFATGLFGSLLGLGVAG